MNKTKRIEALHLARTAAGSTVVYPASFHDEKVVNPRWRGRYPDGVIPGWRLRVSRLNRERNQKLQRWDERMREADASDPSQALEVLNQKKRLAGVACSMFDLPRYAEALMFQAIEDVIRKVARLDRGIASVSRGERHE
jgi:hypothetical protein